MSAAKEVSARFDLVPKFKLTVSKSGTGQGSVTSSPVGISCGATCSAEYEEGKEVTLTAAPEGGSTFAGWSGSGCSGTSTCKVTMSAAKEVAATFNPPPVVDAKLKIEKEGTGTGTVTSSPSGISCGATCESEYVEGTEVELTAAPSAGSKFVSWSGCTSESANHCKVKLTTSKVVKVRFDLIPKFALKVKKTGTGSGKVESTAPLSPKISCGTECEKEFEEGTKVTLVQSAAAGSKFSEWSGACTGTGTCEVTMSAAKEVSARFDLVPKFKLTVSKSGTGAGTVASTPAGVECGGTCSAEFEAGTEVELTASPEEGSEFLKWGGACSGTGSCQVTMSTAKSVSATFKAIPTHKLTVAKSGTGQGRVVSSPPITAIDCGTVCEAKLQAGTEVELIATPDPGSEFFKWSGACAGTGPCEVTMSAGKSVHATFKEAPKFMLSVIKTGPGSVTSSPAGIECGTQCAHEYSAGTALTLSATPARGYRLKGWSGCDGASGPTCTLRVNGARSLSATFVLTKCKKGFHRRKVNGKPRCARRRRHASHRPGARNSLALPAFWP
jgi:Fe-S cluster biogenesis protein NfuA